MTTPTAIRLLGPVADASRLLAAEADRQRAAGIHPALPSNSPPAPSEVSVSSAMAEWLGSLGLELVIAGKGGRPLRSRLDTRQAADHLGLSRSTLEKLRVGGGGPTYIKMGGRVVYDVADLDRWLAAHRKSNTSEVLPMDRAFSRMRDRSRLA